jgi:hypothetical protein
MSREQIATLSEGNADMALAPALNSPSIEQIVQATGQQLSRAAYTTCYCASYAVTFPIVFLAHLIPGGRPLAAGIGDGAHAALDYVRATKASRKRLRRQETRFDDCETST